MSSLAELAERHKNTKLNGKKLTNFKLGKNVKSSTSSGLSLKDLLNQKPKTQLPKTEPKLSVNMMTLLNTAKEQKEEEIKKTELVSEKLKSLRITPTVTR